jgi:deoxyribonucleoside regulator
MEGREDVRLMIRLAEMHYKKDMTQRQISRITGLSTTKVCNLIKLARRQGFVDIHIMDPFEEVSVLEEELKQIFGLRDVVLVPGPFDSQDVLLRCLGDAGAKYLQHILRDGLTIGIAGGMALSYLVTRHEFRISYKVTVVPLVGGQTSDSFQYNANSLAAQLAQKLRCNFLQFNFPIFVDNKEIRDAILADSSARAILGVGEKSDIALIGIGVATESSLIVGLPSFGMREIAKLRERGAVGEISGHFLDIDGRVCSEEHENRTLGLSLEETRKIPRVIGISGGPGKILPILAALRGRWTDTLISDEPTAKSVLEMEKARLKRPPESALKTD